MDKQQAIYTFWKEATGLACYDDSAIPEDAKLPYVTYETMIDSLDNEVAPTGTIWMRTASWAPLDSILSSLETYIGRGKLIPMDSGVMLVNRGNPFAQRTNDEIERSVKGYLINLSVEYLSN